MTELEIENDSIEAGDEVMVSPFDVHLEHIDSHRNKSATSDDSEVRTRFLMHIQEHIDMLQRNQ